MAAGLGLAGLIYFGAFGVREMLILFLFSLLLFVVYNFAWKIPIVHWCVNQMEREDVIKRKRAGIGILWYVLGVLIVLFFFPVEIALAGLMILSLGDGVAPLFGSFGKIQYVNNKRKTLEGVAAGVLVGSLGAWLFVPWYEALLAALFSMGLEGLDLKVLGWKIDDNLLVPVVAGIVIWLVRIII